MRRFFLQPYQKAKLYLLLGDILSLSFIMLLGLSFNLYQHKIVSSGDIANLSYNYILFSCLSIFSFYILGLYQISNGKRLKYILLPLWLSFAVVVVSYVTLAYFLVTFKAGKQELLIFIISAGLITSVWHLVVSKRIKLEPQRLLFVGDNKLIRELKELITTEYAQYYQVTGHWHQKSHNPSFPDLFQYVNENKVDAIVYSVHSQILPKLSHNLLKIRFKQKNIYAAHSFYQWVTGKFPIHYLDDFWMLITCQREFFFPDVSAKLKRVFDIFFALCCLPLALPLIVIAGLAIKFESEGPVFFIQERLGLYGASFKLIKLRTMIHNAEKQNGPQWCKDNDNRITKIGKLLRKFRLDELPQLINVLKGDMSVVGPRPIRKYFTEILSQQIPYYNLRLLAKPGLTGWAQVSNGHANTVEGHGQMAQFDLFYLVNQSLWLDLYIIIKTIKVVIWSKGR